MTDAPATLTDNAAVATRTGAVTTTGAAAATTTGTPSVVGTGRDEHLLLFNTATYHRLNLRDGERFVRVDVDNGERLIGTVAGVLTDGTFCSGYRAPFGGPDLLRGSETVEHLRRLVDGAVAGLAAEGARTVRLRARSECYGPSESTLQFVLLNAGFAVEACELSFHVDLAGLRDADDYRAALKPPARRALRHSGALGLEFTEAATEGEWAAAYGVIARNREAKGRPMRLSFPYVLAIRNAFPGRIRMYALRHAGRACAAALVYRVRPRQDYVVAWGDDHALARSPMNLLAHEVVATALADGVTLLDLGISSEAGRPNPGLIQFKQSILARPTLRLDLVRDLTP